jgi:hypothetical protein
MTEPNLFEIYTKVAADRNPATPAKASEQKPGDVNRHDSLPASYFEGGKAVAQKAGDVLRHKPPGDGYVNLDGPKGPGKQGLGLVNRHSAPDTGERGSVAPGDMTVTKDAEAKTAMSTSTDKTTVNAGKADGRGKGRPWLKNQGVGGANTMTKDATFHDIGVAAALLDMEG